MLYFDTVKNAALYHPWASLCVVLKMPLNQRTQVRLIRGIFKRLDLHIFKRFASLPT